MRALVLNCMLDGSPEPAICAELRAHGVFVQYQSAASVGWPIGHYEITVLVTPSWLGFPSSLAERALALLPEAGVDRVAAAVPVGDRADKHQVRRTFSAELSALGYTVPLRPNAEGLLRAAVRARSRRVLAAVS